MSADVIPLVSPKAIDDAWNAFSTHASRLHDNPSLLRDREYMEQHALLHERWRRLFLRSES